MILYHFHTSPFARRVRLVLAAKGLSAELRDPRQEDKWWPELHRLNPLQTVPTLVDGERVLTDSLTITAYLDELVPTPAVWPKERSEALEIVRLTDRAIDTIVDLGLRYFPAPDPVKAKMLGRAQGALDLLGRKINDAPFLVGDTWSIADIAVVTAGLWFAGLPARAETTPLARQIVDVGWTVPPALAAWTAARKSRPDVASLLP